MDFNNTILQFWKRYSNLVLLSKCDIYWSKVQFSILLYFITNNLKNTNLLFTNKLIYYSIDQCDVHWPLNTLLIKILIFLRIY